MNADFSVFHFGTYSPGPKSLEFQFLYFSHCIIEWSSVSFILVGVYKLHKIYIFKYI